jgi:hypothetical protein
MAGPSDQPAGSRGSETWTFWALVVSGLAACGFLALELGSKPRDELGIALAVVAIAIDASLIFANRRRARSRRETPQLDAGDDPAAF